jgi:hypothetical protein
VTERAETDIQKETEGGWRTQPKPRNARLHRIAGKPHISSRGCRMHCGFQCVRVLPSIR